MPELSDAQKAVLTEEQQKHYDHHKKCDKDGQSCISVRSLISLADVLIKSEARRKMLKKHEFCKPEGGCPECTVTTLEHFRHHSNCALDTLLAEEE